MGEIKCSKEVRELFQYLKECTVNCSTEYNVYSTSDRKDMMCYNSICFRKNGKNVYIPIENTKELFCLNEVSLNSKLLDFLSQNHVIVHFFNYYGMYSGTFYPKDQYLSGRLLVAQVNKYQTDR